MMVSYDGDVSVVVVTLPLGTGVPEYCHHTREKLFSPVKTVSLTAPELTDRVRLGFSTMKASMEWERENTKFFFPCSFGRLFPVCLFSTEYKKTRTEGKGCRARTTMNTKAHDDPT